MEYPTNFVLKPIIYLDIDMKEYDLTIKKYR